MRRIFRVRWLTIAGLALIASASNISAADKQPCTDLSRACMIEVARTYLDARTDSSLLPFQRVAPKITRWENGVVTAEKAADILRPAGPGPNPMTVPRNLDRVWVDGNQLLYFWIIDRRDTPDGPFTKTAHITERVQIEAGPEKCGSFLSPCITELEVVLCVSPHADEQRTPSRVMDPEWPKKFMCYRES